MSDTSQGEGWWIASDNKWYPPEQHPGYTVPAANEPVKPSSPTANYAAETVAMPAASPGVPVPQANTAPSFAPAGGDTQHFGQEVGTDPNYDLPATNGPAPSKRRLILSVGALVLFAGVGFLSFQFFTGASSAGGADSPEAAIDQLIASVNERDAVGFVDVFDPDEIEAWFDGFTPAFAGFEKIDAQGEPTNAISGTYASIFTSFDYLLTGHDGDSFTYDVKPLDNDGRITRVRIKGLDFALTLDEADTSVIVGFGDDPSAIDIGQLDGSRLELRDDRAGLVARLLIPGEPIKDAFVSDVHIDLVTVQKDDKWFVSMGYTFLEIARNQGEFADYPRPDFGRAFSLVDDQTGGAESPQAVVQQMFTAIETLDYATIIEITDPYATPYLHDYQPLIDSRIDEADRQTAGGNASLHFDELELSTSEWEGRTLVTTRDIGATGNGWSFTADTTDWCLTIKQDFDRETVCLEDGISELLFAIDSDLDPRDFIPEETGFVVVERNGRWYLDPLATVGFYADQLGEAGAAIADGFEGSPVTEIGNFFIVKGPIARQNSPATTQAESGSAGVALDLSGYPQISTDFHVAVARVVTDQPGTFVSSDGVPLTGEDWVVTYESVHTDIEIPAIAVSTNGSLDVELFEVQVIEVGLDGFTGQFGGQGSPQVLVFSEDTFGADITVDGASADTVFGWEPNGVVLNRPDDSLYIGDGAFTVIYGEPGASFSINVDVFEPEPDPTPEPAPVPNRTDSSGDMIATAFAGLVEPEGYFLSETQPGGFFDGCGGPNDPDVTSHIFGGNGNLIVTPYPTVSRAEIAFNGLVNVVTPCAVFSDIEIINISTINNGNTLIAWQFIDEPDSATYEHYRLVGETIVVATNSSIADLELQLNILDGW